MSDTVPISINGGPPVGPPDFGLSPSERSLMVMRAITLVPEGMDAEAALVEAIRRQNEQVRLHGLLTGGAAESVWYGRPGTNKKG